MPRRMATSIRSNCPRVGWSTRKTSGSTRRSTSSAPPTSSAATPGSPVVNKAGEVVGIIFDGNIQSLVLAYAYTDKIARSVSVHTAAISEALEKIYGAQELLNELGK